MKKTSETILFFGSGPVAAQSLKLLKQDFTVEAVITKPRPPHHHGIVPVLDVVQELQLPAETASNKAELDDLFAHKKFQSRLGVLIDFGIIVSQAVIDYFELGIINSHFSLLPEWRGADPITFSVLSGQPVTGVSLMLLSAGMDEGPLLAQTPIDIPADVTTPDLTDTLIELSYQSLRQIVPLYLQGQVTPAPQEVVSLAPSKQPTYSRRLSKQDGIIDWKKPAEQLEREIRAFTGWPQSQTTLGGKELIICEAKVVKMTGKPGQIIVKDRHLIVSTSKDSLEILELKPAGKTAMTASAFLAGYSKLLEQAEQLR